MSQHFSFSRRGLQPATKLAVLAAVSVLLLVLDKRYEGVGKGRQYLATVLYPLQWFANKPVEIYDYFYNMVQSQDYLLNENRRLTADNARLKLEARQAVLRLRELSELKTLAALQQHGLQATTTAEVVSAGKEPVSDRVAVNKGSRHGVKAGDAAVDEGGLLGQVAQVQPLSAEINLLTEAGMVVPVMVERTGVRTLVYGGGGALALRYFPTDADLRPDDVLVTSGLDDVYPAGIPVAKVLQAGRNAGTPYYRVRLEPFAAPRRSRYVLVLPQQPAFQAAASDAALSSDSP
ncbi:MAG: rod shape-determining protein MreC [Conchiformibius sp.]|nr:rod shape-determining protein MreC [Conchiformibius sp.]